MRNLLYALSSLLILSNFTAQNVGINTTGANPDNSSMLDVVATDKGMLIPRVALTATNLAGPITAPTTSLLVYNTASAGVGATAVTPGFYYWDGASWERFDTSNNEGDWKITGNANTTAGTNFLGTTNGQALDFRTNNVQRFRVANGNQVLAMANGSAAVPFYSWDADDNSGFYELGADAIGISTGGTERVRIANGATVFNQTGANTDFRVASDGDANMIYVDGGNNRVGIGIGVPLTTLHVDGGTQINALAGAGNRMVIADANGLLATQAIPNGDITGVTAGDGLVGGGTAGTVTVNVVATNGLTTNPNDIRLGGALIQNTTITQAGFDMTYNLNGTGDFNIQDNGTSTFRVFNDGTTDFGDDVDWRDGSTAGTLLMSFIDDGNDGRLRIYENGNVSIDFDANTQVVFNEQGLDRNFRIESDNQANQFFIDAGTNRIGVRTGTPGHMFHMTNGGENVGANSMGTFDNLGADGVALSASNENTGNANNAFEGITEGTYTGVFGLGITQGTGGDGVFGQSNDWQSIGVVGSRFNSGGPNSGFGGLFINDLGYTGGAFNVSDRRLKKDIKPLNGALEIITKLNPVTYKYKSDEYSFLSSNDHMEFGFIAQEVETVLPEIVEIKTLNTNLGKEAKPNSKNVEDNQDFYMMDYTRIIPILTKALQEQQEIINAQAEKLDALEKKLEALTDSE